MRPFKVICIENDDNDSYDCIGEFDVEVGKTYTAIHQVVGIGKSGKRVFCYILQEQPDKKDACFPCSWFMPTSEIDETEMIRESNTITA